jgi:hypothetical protein
MPLQIILVVTIMGTENTEFCEEVYSLASEPRRFAVETV